MAAKYDRIGDGYDLTRRADPRIADRLTSLLDAAPGASVLDVACGTGNYTFALADFANSSWILSIFTFFRDPSD